LDPQRWVQIEELFHRACECDPKQRARLLDESGSGDPELRRTVERLLASAEAAANGLQAAVYGGLDAVAFPLVGEEISHYRIFAGIGTGGMGSVYRAEDVKLRRQVALKVLAEEFARDPCLVAPLPLPEEPRHFVGDRSPHDSSVAGAVAELIPLVYGELRQVLVRPIELMCSRNVRFAPPFAHV
jgi:serine/threonine protein kinase